MKFENSPWTLTKIHTDKSGDVTKCHFEFNDRTGGGGHPAVSNAIRVYDSLEPTRIEDLLDHHKVPEEEVRYYIQQRCAALGAWYELEEISPRDWTKNEWFQKTKNEEVFPQMKL